MGKIFGSIVLLSLALSACATAPEATPDEEITPEVIEDPISDGLPAGAIEVGDDVYMVPAGAPDAEGCQAFSLYSPVKRVDQSIYYRTADGRFVRNRLEADCS